MKICFIMKTATFFITEILYDYMVSFIEDVQACSCEHHFLITKILMMGTFSSKCKNAQQEENT